MTEQCLWCGVKCDSTNAKGECQTCEDTAIRKLNRDMQRQINNYNNSVKDDPRSEQAEAREGR
jgi:hypothetical protein